MEYGGETEHNFAGSMNSSYNNFEFDCLISLSLAYLLTIYVLSGK